MKIIFNDDFFLAHMNLKILIYFFHNQNNAQVSTKLFYFYVPNDTFSQFHGVDY